jgi:hypothetical protein
LLNWQDLPLISAQVDTRGRGMQTFYATAPGVTIETISKIIDCIIEAAVMEVFDRFNRDILKGKG